MASGTAHSCAVLADGTMTCWGANTSGQLGNGTTKTHTKAAAVSNLAGVVGVAAGGAHTCALLSDGSVKCWGANALGQLGLGTTDGQLTPSAAVALDGPAIAITAGSGPRPSKRRDDRDRPCAQLRAAGRWNRAMLGKKLPGGSSGSGSSAT